MEAERVNDGILAVIEKKTLIWLAERMPARVNSDHLTTLGFLSLAAVGLSYWYARYSKIGLALAIVFFVLNWFGDSLDGTLARVRNRQRPRYRDSIWIMFSMRSAASSFSRASRYRDI